MIRTKKFENLPQITSISPSGKIVVTENGVDKVISFEDFSNLPPAAEVWNNPSTTFTASEINVTDIQSAADSKLLDLKINTVSKFVVRKDGNLGIGVANPAARLDISDIVLAGSGSLAGSILNLAQTWNTTGNPTAIKLNVTNTGSGATSNLLDLQVGGDSKLRVDKTGRIYFPAQFSSSKPYIGPFGSYGLSLFGDDVDIFATYSLRLNGNPQISGYLQFGLNTNSLHPILYKDADSTIGQRNGISPQSFRIYNTYTSSTNFERLNLRWDTNVLKIGTEKGTAGGTARNLGFETDGTTRMTITSTGLVGIGTTNPAASLDIQGASSGIFLGRSDSEKYIYIVTSPSTGYTANSFAIWNGITAAWAGLIMQFTENAALIFNRDIQNAYTNIRGANLSEPALNITQTSTGDFLSAGSLRVAKNGNIGIGITVPTAVLDIVDTTLSGSGSLAGSALNIAQTWNTTGAPTAIKLNVTDTASSASSNLLDLQVGGSSVLKIDKTGSIFFTGATSAATTRTNLGLGTGDSPTFTNIYVTRLSQNSSNTSDISYDGFGNIQFRYAGVKIGDNDGDSSEWRWSSKNRTTYIKNNGVYTAGRVAIGITVPTAKLDIAETWNSNIAITGASGTGSIATVTFASQGVAIPIGSTVIVSNVNPAGYNGTFVVTASSVTSVSYANVTTTSYVSGGTVQQLFNALNIDITDTASNIDSNFLNLKVSGITKFKVNKDGGTYSPYLVKDSSYLSSRLIPASYLGPWILRYNGEPTSFIAFGQNLNGYNGFSTNRDGMYGWSSDNSSATAGMDLRLFRDTAGTLAQRNGINAQTFRLYNTYTDATTFERLNIKWETNVLKIGTEKGTSGGTARAMELQTDGTSRWAIDTSGRLIAQGHYGVFSMWQGGFHITAGGTSTIARFYGDNGHSRIASYETSLCLEIPRLTFNGTTSAFPAIKRNGAGIQIRLADDSANTTLEAGNIYATGNVGIGTTSPGAPLHLQATAVTNTRESLLKCTLSDAGNDAFHIYNGTGVDGRFSPGFSASTFTSNIGFLLFGSQTTSANDSGTSPLMIFQSRLTTSETDPNNGTLSIVNTRPLFAWNNFTTTYMQMSANGNLGIGTTTPSSKLHIAGPLGSNTSTYDSEAALRITNTTGDSSWILTSGIIGVLNANFCIRYSGNATPAFVISNQVGYSNNVGIQVNNPTARLDIADTTLAGSGSLAGSILNLAQTWNTTGAPTAIKLNVTNTASGAASNLLDLQVDTVSKFKVDKSGVASMGGITITDATPQYQIKNAIGIAGFNFLYNSEARAQISDYGLNFTNYGIISWASSSSSHASNRDLYLFRDAAATLAQRNGVNAQAFRLYNTYTDATTFERLNIKWDTNVLKIGTEKGNSGGTARAIEFQTDGTTRMTLPSTGGLSLPNGSDISFGGAFNFYGTTSSTTINGPTAFGQVGVSINGSDKWIFKYDGLLCGGGTTSSFPALKRNGAGIQIRLADDSANAALETAGLTVVGSASVSGHFSAATKSFLIDHPTKEGKKLQYGVVESNQHSVLVRGKTAENIIELPEEWAGLVHEDSVTVQLTPIGSYQQLFVISQDNQRVVVGGSTGQYNYTIYGERKDVDKLITEI